MEASDRAKAMWKLYERGASLREVGARFGITGSGVSHVLRKTGYPVERGGPQVRARRRAREMYALYEQGLTLAEVGQRFGISGVSVGDTFQKFGLSRRPARGPSRVADRIGEMYGHYVAGATLAQVARQFGISESRVSELFKDAGLPTRTRIRREMKRP